MSGAAVGFGLSVFLACAVEAVEALTIVLAAGATRGWRWALSGVAAALIALAAIVAAAGPALAALPLAALRVGVGVVLLTFGLHWLRKAVLRAAGRKPLHDEGAIYRAQVQAAHAGGRRDRADPRREGRFDRYAFGVAFQGVFVEGCEIVVIVLSFSASNRRLGLAAAAAGLALLAVALLGLVVHRPLTRVPENAMKLLVGVMLVSFGVFWGADGAGLRWPGGDGALVALALAVLACSLALARLLRTMGRSGAGRPAEVESVALERTVAGSGADRA